MDLTSVINISTKRTGLALVFTGLLNSLAIADNHSITVDSVNLSASDFLSELTSKSPERRTSAKLYLLGVLDSTEGKSWCSYSQLKSITLNEFVFEHLKKQSTERLSLRAAVLIEEALHNSFPCKDAK